MRLTDEQARALGIGHLIPAPPKRPADAMNKTERLYAAHLRYRVEVGEVLRFDFEPFKLRLADRTWYTPDFRVILADGSTQCHEIKGFWRDDARVKIKVAAELHPYVFVAVQRRDGRWHFETFEAKQR